YQSLKEGEKKVLTIAYTVDDGTGTTNATDSKTLTITVTGTNDLPTASNTTVPGSEDSPTTGTLPAYTDIDGDPCTYKAGKTPAVGGTVVVNADGTYTFTPNKGFSGQGSFTYVVNDGHGDSVEYTVTVNVAHVNHAPVAQDASAAAKEDGAVVSGKLVATDVDGDTLTYSTTAAAPAGFTLNADGSWLFDPSDAAYQSLKEGEKKVLTIAYQVNDGNAVNGTATATLTITVTGTNDVPIANASVAAATEGATPPVSGDLVADGYVSDPDGDSLTFSINSTVPGFSLQPDGKWTFDAANAAYKHLKAGEQQDVIVNYTVDDGHGGKTAGQITITITGVNDAPVAQDASAAAKEDGPAISGSLTATDPDGDTLTYSFVQYTDFAGAVQTGLPAGFIMNADGTWNFDPSNAAYQSLKEGETKTLTVTYKVDDGNGGTDTKTLTITVTGTNDAPIASASIAAATEGATPPISGDLIAGGYVSDPDGDSLTFSINSAVPGFSLQPDGKWTFDPANAAYKHLKDGEQQDVIVNYTVDDGHGGKTVGQITITVTGVNNAPVAQAATASATEDGSVVSGSLTATDPDGDALTYSFVEYTDLSGAVQTGLPEGFNLSADGKWTFDPTGSAYQFLAEGQSKDLVIKFKVSDGQAETEETLTITITGTNDLPTASDITVSQGVESGKIYNGNLPAAHDVDTLDIPNLTYLLGKTLPQHGTVVVNPDGTYTYTAAANYNGTDTFTYVVNDTHGNSTEYTVTLGVADKTLPTIAVSAGVAAGGIVNTATGTVSVNFQLSEDSSDFGLASIQVTGGTLQNFTKVSGSLYTAEFVPAKDFEGTASIFVDSGKFHDLAGNANADGADTDNTASFTVDTKAPTATLTIDKMDDTSGSGNGDNILNIAESKTTQIITGTAGGDAKAGDTVTLTVNGKTYSGVLDSS
ncbi:Ig-like domain-containing protein, partial [Stenoxybacter acetivorans]|uniref:Ig-like domain-containing protein n=1 Tax=Stenoxybacter acetivorans TaxID=422441 RepID=UPI00055DDC0D